MKDQVLIPINAPMQIWCVGGIGKIKHHRRNLNIGFCSATLIAISLLMVCELPLSCADFFTSSNGGPERTRPFHLPTATTNSVAGFHSIHYESQADDGVDANAHKDMNVDTATATTWDSPQLNCIVCSSHQINKHRRLNDIKMDILLKLGLPHPPLAKFPGSPPRRNVSKILPLGTLLESQVMQSDLQRSDDDFSFKPEKVISFGGPLPSELRFLPEEGATYFSISPKVRLNMLDKTILHVFIRPPSEWSDARVESDRSARTTESGINHGGGNEARELEVSLYTLHTPHRYADNSRSAFTTPPSPALASRLDLHNYIQSDKRYHTKQKVLVGENGTWVIFRMQKIFPLWLEDPDNNQGIAVFAFDNHGRNQAVMQPTPKEFEYGPYLEIRLDDDLRRHRRNSESDCSEAKPASYCCRYPLTVNFSEFGWDFVIAPRVYEAFYCSGECKYGRQAMNTHAHLRSSLFTGSSADMDTGLRLAGADDEKTSHKTGPCCTPSKMSDLMMLYYDNDGAIVYGRIPAMIANRCACA